MWHMKVLAVLVVVLGALLFGAVIAYAGWGWNSKVDVDGTVISTEWTVTDDEDGANDYRAKIIVTVPAEADASVVEITRRVENLKLRYSHDLECTEDGINATVSYVVKHTAKGEGGENVMVTVSTVGMVSEELASASGPLGEPITVDVLIPGSCSDDDQDGHSDDDDDDRSDDD